MQLGNGIQVVVQTQCDRWQFRCEGFVGVPVVTPCLITIAATDTTVAYEWAEELRRALTAFILGTSQGLAAVQPLAVPCDGGISDLFACHAHQVVEATKLLVLVGNPARPFSQMLDYERWARRAGTHRLLPVFPRRANVAQLLPLSTLSLQNAVFWDVSIVETVSEVLAVVGLTAEDYRIFISYYRPDTQSLADQLFDALSHAQFDVYLDRFRTPPAVNFQPRLEQELLDKALILVLESQNLPRSGWCQHEIGYAIRHRLGLLALQLPNAPTMSGITPQRRRQLDLRDMDPARKMLVPNALTDVVAFIKQEHARALIHRRQYIQLSMLYALTLEKVPVTGLSSDGLLHVQSLKAPVRSYALWLTTRSPELTDFIKTDHNRNTNERGIVLGPGITEAARRDRLAWLSTKSNILIEDESRLTDVARDVARGNL